MESTVLALLANRMVERHQAPSPFIYCIHASGRDRGGEISQI